MPPVPMCPSSLCLPKKNPLYLPWRIFSDCHRVSRPASSKDLQMAMGSCIIATSDFAARKSRCAANAAGSTILLFSISSRTLSAVICVILTIL